MVKDPDTGRRISRPNPPSEWKRADALTSPLSVAKSLPPLRAESRSHIAPERQRRVRGPISDTGVQHIEGPEAYTAQDVADAFADAIGRRVDVQEIPRDALEETFGQFGFSDEAAASYACMTGRLIDGQTDATSEPVRGKTSLREYIRSVLGAD